MSLSSYGKPKYEKQIQEMLIIDKKFNFKLNLKFLNITKLVLIYSMRQVIQYLMTYLQKKLKKNSTSQQGTRTKI